MGSDLRDDDTEGLLEHLESGLEEAAATPLSNMLDVVDPKPIGVTVGDDGMAVDIDPPYSSDAANPVPMTPATLTCMKQPDAPACRFYARQRVLDLKASERPIIHRICVCPDLKLFNGATMNLNDAGIFDCELRDPPLRKTVEVLDAVDDVIVERGRVRMEHEQETGRQATYPLFRTIEDYDKGVYEREEGDFGDPERDEQRLQEYLQLRKNGLVGPKRPAASEAELSALQEDDDG